MVVKAASARVLVLRSLATAVATAARNSGEARRARWCVWAMVAAVALLFGIVALALW